MVVKKRGTYISITSGWTFLYLSHACLFKNLLPFYLHISFTHYISILVRSSRLLKAFYNLCIFYISFVWGSGLSGWFRHFFSSKLLSPLSFFLSSAHHIRYIHTSLSHHLSSYIHTYRGTRTRTPITRNQRKDPREEKHQSNSPSILKSALLPNVPLAYKQRW